MPPAGCLLRIPAASTQATAPPAAAAVPASPAAAPAPAPAPPPPAAKRRKVKAAGKEEVQDNAVPDPGAVARRGSHNHPMQPSHFVGDKDEKGSSMVYLDSYVTWVTHLTWDMDHDEASDKISELKNSNRNLLPLSPATYLKACTESTF